MSETAIHYIVNAAVYASMGLGFFLLTNHAIKWYYRQTLEKIRTSVDYGFKQTIPLIEEVEVRFETLEKKQNEILELVESIEEKIVMIHQDILYLDQDFDDMEERIIRLEYRPGKTEPTTIEAQAVPPRMERSMRRMRELRRRTRG